MAEQTQPLAEQIRAAISERKVVLFCGAGISMDPPATLPDWGRFRDETIKAIASREKTLEHQLPMLLSQGINRGEKRALAPEFVATQVRAVVPSYFRSLRALDHDHFNANHALIAHLAKEGFVHYIVTTNFDQLLERALDAYGVKPRVYRLQDDFELFLARPAEDETIAVLKLHGCISNPNTIVATVEQESVGLSPAKSAVLRSLWSSNYGLFWGYSGADLKIDLDYLQMVTASSEAPGFFWNLHTTPTWREVPNKYVQRLIEQYEGRGMVCHINLREELARLIGETPESTHSILPDEISTLVEKRSTELAEALRVWAREAVHPIHALEIFARLQEKVGNLSTAANTYYRLGNVAFEQEDSVSVALGYARAREVLARMGDLHNVEPGSLRPVGEISSFKHVNGPWTVIDELGSTANDRARRTGSVNLLLINARTSARTNTIRGQFLSSMQPRAFARLLSKWTSNNVTADVLEVEIDTARQLIAQRLLEPALKLLEEVEFKARNAGLLETALNALEQKRYFYVTRGEQQKAVECINEIVNIATALGMQGKIQLYEFQRRLTEGAPGSVTPIIFSELNEILTEDVTGLPETRERCELLLVILESVQEFDLKYVPQWLNEVATHVNEGGRDLAVRLVVQWILLQQQLGYPKPEHAIEMIEAVIADMKRCGQIEYYAITLLLTLAELKRQVGRTAKEVLECLEEAARRTRNNIGILSEIESNLAQFRQAMQVGQYPTDYEAFVNVWQEYLDQFPDVLRALSQLAGMRKTENLGDSLKAQYGADGRFVWSLLMVVDKLSEQYRIQGRPDESLRLAQGCLAMAQLLGDEHIAARIHNISGLSLFELGRIEEARTEFDLAISAAEPWSGSSELIDGLNNAATACMELSHPNQALDYYEKMLAEVRIRDDLPAALNLALGAGKALMAVGRYSEAETHLAAAEYYARTMDDRRIDEITINLAKVYEYLGEPERSIYYKCQIMEFQQRRGIVREAAYMAAIVASSYEELKRPLDARDYYHRALEISKKDPDLPFQDDLRERLSHCEAFLSTEGIRTPSLYEILIKACGSVETAEGIAVSLAIATDFNLWQFGLRNFAAWFERIFGVTPKSSKDLPEGLPMGAQLALLQEAFNGVSKERAQQGLPFWPSIATAKLLELGKMARTIHEYQRAFAFFAASELVADTFDLPKKAEDARNETTKLKTELGAVSTPQSNGRDGDM